MADPYVGEIRMFAGNFPPVGWEFCSGQTLPISENETLFNLIGTTYGGDGQDVFNLPNLQSRVPIHQGQGPGLSNYTIGESGGVESVTLTHNQIPVHTHKPQASNTGSSDNPANGFWANSPLGKPFIAAPPTVQMNAGTITATGRSQPYAHDNMIPFLCVNYIISLFGIYPPQN